MLSLRTAERIELAKEGALAVKDTPSLMAIVIGSSVGSKGFTRSAICPPGVQRERREGASFDGILKHWINSALKSLVPRAEGRFGR